MTWPARLVFALAVAGGTVAHPTTSVVAIRTAPVRFMGVARRSGRAGPATATVRGRLAGDRFCVLMSTVFTFRTRFRLWSNNVGR